MAASWPRVWCSAGAQLVDKADGVAAEGDAVGSALVGGCPGGQGVDGGRMLAAWCSSSSLRSVACLTSWSVASCRLSLRSSSAIRAGFRWHVAAYQRSPNRLQQPAISPGQPIFPKLASGERGIRTHGEVAPTAVFKTAAIGH